jgi:site-specific DNA-methyltransferase (adenine-specific)
MIFCPVEALGKIQHQFIGNYIRGGVWDRVNPSPQMSGDRPAQAVEGIAILHPNDIKKKWNGHGRAGIWRESVEFGRKEHETQKPLKLMIKLLNDFSINKTEIVFDPFMGSGTIAVACERLGRKWLGCELDPKYCAIAQARIDAERAQLKLF